MSLPRAVHRFRLRYITALYWSMTTLTTVGCVAVTASLVARRRRHFTLNHDSSNVTTDRSCRNHAVVEQLSNNNHNGSYGDITPVSNNEKIYCFVAMVLGVGFFTLIVGNITALMTATSYSERVFTKHMQAIRGYHGQSHLAALAARLLVRSLVVSHRVP